MFDTFKKGTKSVKNQNQNPFCKAYGKNKPCAKRASENWNNKYSVLSEHNISFLEAKLSNKTVFKTHYS